MSDSFPRLRVVARPGPEALLDALPVAAAALDPDLRIESVNPAFQRLLGQVEGLGQQLGQLFQLEDSLLPTDREQQLRARLPGGAPVLLHLAPKAGGHALVVLPVRRDEASEERAQKVLLALSREVLAAPSEAEQVAALARALHQLFPGASYAIRVLDPRSLAVTAVFAEGRMHEQHRDELVLPRAAAEKVGLDLQSLPPHRLKLDDAPPLLFHGTAHGSTTPLVAMGQLFGLVTVEFPADHAREARSQERLVIRAANMTASGLRQAKLLDEVTEVRRYLEQVIENADALIAVLDPRGRVLMFNEALCRLTGLSREAVVGRKWTELIAPEDRGRAEMLVDRSLSDGNHARLQVALLRSQDSARIPTALATAAIRGPRGMVEGVIAVGHDLTRLETLERQLIQAEKLASLGELAAGVAHEINNPLTTITIYADALVRRARQGSWQPGDGEKLERILDAGHRILKLSRDLTRYARPGEDTPAPVSMVEVVEQAVGFCDHVLKEAEVRLVTHLPEGLPRVLGVQSQFVQVVINLVTNAAQATAPGGGIVVRLETLADGSVGLSVEDSGSGIPPEFLARVFEPFFTTKPEGQGTGLGLSIVQGIVARHGGTIEVGSELGTGTRFLVRLPAAGSGMARLHKVT